MSHFNRRDFFQLSAIPALLGFCFGRAGAESLEWRGPEPITGENSQGRRIAVIWGIVSEKPVRTCLPGRIRIRLRNDDFARAFVRHQGSTRHFILFDFGDHWQIGLEQGSNLNDRAA